MHNFATAAFVNMQGLETNFSHLMSNGRMAWLYSRIQRVDALGSALSAGESHPEERIAQ
jgi:hypothetical protein